MLVTALIDDGTDGNVIRARLQKQRLAALEIIDLGFTTVNRRLANSGQMDGQRAESAISDLVDLLIERAGHRHSIRRCWGLRLNLTAYDAALVALAEFLHVSLWTSDSRLAGAPGIRCGVHVFGRTVPRSTRMSAGSSLIAMSDCTVRTEMSGERAVVGVTRR